MQFLKIRLWRGGLLSFEDTYRFERFDDFEPVSSSNVLPFPLFERDETKMSSMEIAELTEKEHKNVVRDIHVLFQQLGVDRLKFEQIYLA